MSGGDSRLRAWLGLAWGGMRLYWPAFVLMQLCAFALAFSYYKSEWVREASTGLAAWKISAGTLGAALANVVSGLVLPELLKWKLRPKGMKGPGFIELLDMFFMFAVLGAAVERFYTFQEWLFGPSDVWWRVAAKILADQFVYTPFVAVPIIIVWFFWRENGYSFRKTFRNLKFSTFTDRLPALYAPNLLFWTPSLIAVYSLPLSLQIPLFLLLNTAWCVIMVFIARRQSDARG